MDNDICRRTRTKAHSRWNDAQDHCFCTVLSLCIQNLDEIHLHDSLQEISVQ